MEKNIGKVSIIVPVYNTPEEYLEECINSLTNQVYSDIEILLIDDGSEKEISNLLDIYEEKYRKIKVIHKENEGVAAARNTGISKASGEWIMFVDSDDWIPKDAICKLTKFPKSEIIIGRACFHWQDDDEVSDKHYDDFQQLQKEKSLKEILIKNILIGKNREESFAAIWAKLYNKNFLISNNIFFSEGVKLGEDILFNVKAYEKSNKISLINDVVYDYRINSNSVTQKYSPKTIKDVDNLLMNCKNNIWDVLSTKYIGEYNAFVIRQINYVFIKSIFNKDSELNYKEKKSYIKKYIENELYCEAIKNVKLSLLSPRKKVLAILLKYRLIVIIPFIYKMGMS